MIIDLPDGWQPFEADREGAALVYNGEVYNFIELRAELEAVGESFDTRSDTEVVLRLLEREGLDGLPFQRPVRVAWWHADRRRLTLVRDRFGVRPLHYSLRDDGTLVFGSEAKALFVRRARRGARPGRDRRRLHLWGRGRRRPRSPACAGPAGRPGRLGARRDRRRAALVDSRLRSGRALRGRPGGADARQRAAAVARRRPGGDLPSGGLDSSLITALAQAETEGELRTFSVAFRDPLYDESAFQQEVAEAIGTRHHVVRVGTGEITGAFDEVVRHAEVPPGAHRTGAALPARAAGARGGDHRDRHRGGCRRAVLGLPTCSRRWRCARLSAWSRARRGVARPALPYLGPAAAWRARLAKLPARDRHRRRAARLHLTRVAATAGVKALYRLRSPSRSAPTPARRAAARADPAGAAGWSKLERAAWLEVTTLLEPYLLAAQGDRVAMAHGVEGRYLRSSTTGSSRAARLPAEAKLDGLGEKAALRELAGGCCRRRSWAAGVQPYRAPEAELFFAEDALKRVDEAPSPAALGEVDLGLAAGRGPGATLPRRPRHRDA